MSTQDSFSSVQSLSCVRFFATRPHGLQQARLPYPSPVSGSSAFSKPSLNIWKILNHVLLKFIPPEIKRTMQLRELKLQDYVRIENRSVAYTCVNTEFLIFSKCNVLNQSYESRGPQSFGTGTDFMEDNFPTDEGGGRWFWDDSSVLHLLCTYFYYYYLSSTSDHEALDPGVWKPLIDNLKWILLSYSGSWEINQ